MPDQTRRTLATMREGGVCWLRWFLLCDGRAGIVFDRRGDVVGLDACVLADIDAALDLARELDLRLMFTVFDFLWFTRPRHVNGVQTGGRRRALAAREPRARLLQLALAPILEHCAGRPEVAMWDVINEPEWATFAVGSFDPRRTIRRATMRTLIGEVTTLIRARTAQPVTVGSASAATIDLVRGLGLDWYQVHWYDHLEHGAPLARHVSALNLDRPVLLGEFPTRGSTRAPADVMATARQSGYAGAFFWSVTADDTATDSAAASHALSEWAGTPAASPEGQNT